MIDIVMCGIGYMTVVLMTIVAIFTIIGRIADKNLKKKHAIQEEKFLRERLQERVNRLERECSQLQQNKVNKETVSESGIITVGDHYPFFTTKPFLDCISEVEKLRKEMNEKIRTSLTDKKKKAKK